MPARRHRDQHRAGALLDRRLDDADRIRERFDRSAQVEPADHDQAALEALLQQGAAQRQQRRQAERRAGAVVVHGAELHRELVGARVAVAHQFARAGVQVLLGVAGTLAERRRYRGVEDADAAAGAGRHLDAVERRAGLRPAGADAPHLTRRQRIRVDGVVAAQLRRGHEPFDPGLAQGVAEVGIAELALEHPLLLLLDAAAHFEGDAHQLLQLGVRHRHRRVRVEQLEQTAHRLVDRGEVAPAERAAEVHPALQRRDAAAGAQPAPALRQEVADQSEVIGEVRARIELGKVPARHVGVNAVHERGVVAQVGGQRAEQVAGALLLRGVDIEVADHDHAAVRADALLAARKLARFHVPLEDVHAVLLIEGDAGNLVEADHVVLADQPPLAGGVVDEHLRHRRLAPGYQMGVGGDLLEQMALAGAARPQLHQVVVALHERRHAHQRDELRPRAERGRLQADAAQQQPPPLAAVELAAGALQGVQDVGLR